MVGDYMREVTKLMITDYNLKKLGYDFMGFRFNRTEQLSFHHLIIPHRLCKGIEREGYVAWNGAILVQKTSHEYLHTIEIYDRPTFEYITQQMIEMNQQGKLDLEHLMNINDALKEFEKSFYDLTTRKGKRLSKREYIESRILK
jgi:hypothetical protein